VLYLCFLERTSNNLKLGKRKKAWHYCLPEQGKKQLEETKTLQQKQISYVGCLYVLMQTG
jgi:hypothetical protein